MSRDALRAAARWAGFVAVVYALAGLAYACAAAEPR